MKFSSSLHKINNLIVSPRIKTSLSVASLARPDFFQYPIPMEPRNSLITLGVSDLNRSIIIHRDGLGLPTTFKEGENIAFFQLIGTWLALYPSDTLAKDTRLPPERTRFGVITLAHNDHSKEEADKVISQALAAGAGMLKPTADTFWGGYSGYFSDPDDHPWEVAWNPFFPLE
jgi:catechol 2,3-dioxygenase-like lactoylglutathione lyase family enzyme